MRLLADYAIARHYPDAAEADHPYRAFLAAVTARQADLMARWLLVGFIHGVMNTDNTAISGETIDYGPCAFMDDYAPGTVFSSIDHGGRYAYANQPRIAHWNLTRLAEALLPLLAEDEDAAITAAQDVLGGFAPRFESAYLGGLRRKIGLSTEQPGDADLVQDLLRTMAETGADFTLTFRHLDDAQASGAMEAWSTRWRQRLATEPSTPDQQRTAMHAVNPAIIPHNHLVEAALDAAISREDLAPFEALLAGLSHPYDDRAADDPFTLPPTPDQRVLRTFCGT